MKGKEVTAYKYFKTAGNYMFTKGGIYSKIFIEGSAEDIKRKLAAVVALVWQETRGFFI
ncbi:hypothetical protein [Chryseobacterium sp.]|uniref:hypothetical protein n=1 Tax=Chryseobacterium sp. TaxID=1871047 RepID=UPI0031D4B52D